MGLTGLDPLSVANAQLASAIVDSKSRLAMATRVACRATLASLSWETSPPPKGPARRMPSCLSYRSGWSMMVSTRVGEDAREESELLMLVCEGVKALKGLGDESLIAGWRGLLYMSSSSRSGVIVKFFEQFWGVQVLVINP